MDFRFSPEQEKLRQEVRAFLDEELRKGTFEPMMDSWVEGYAPSFSQKLGQKGWIGYTWPREYGGQAKSYLDRLVITEELLMAGAPVAFHWMGDRQIGPSIIAYGTEEQKREFLPRIIRGEVSFAIGMSEPEAGSDLAGLKSRTVEQEDGFILNGQKVWTGGAHKTDYLYLVARTDPNVPKHKGITEFIVDMKSPGITVRPIIDMTNTHHLNEVYFDNVKVPRSGLIGQKNRGWYQIAAQLDYERSGPERLVSNYLLYKELLAWVKEQGLGANPQVRCQLAEREVELEVGRWLVYRVTWALSRKIVPNYEASLAKVYGTAYQQRLAQTAVEVTGLYGQLLEGSRWARLRGMAARASMMCRAYSIMGGTSEVLRNIVALRGLGLASQAGG